MKFKKIVGFGDSWMWGDELLNPALKDHPHAHPVLIENVAYRESNCFLGQLGAHYNLPVENFGIPGGSLQSTIWNYLWWLEQETLDPAECLILVGLTDSSRVSFYNPNHVSYSNDPPWNRYVHGAWIHSGGCYGKDWVEMAKQHMVLTDCPALRKLNYAQAVLFFNGQSQNHNLWQFCTINPPEVRNESTLLWPDQTLAYFLNTFPNVKELLAEHRHPNELGHQKIAEHLISHLDSCTMYEC
jgi:hypothetical protein